MSSKEDQRLMVMLRIMTLEPPWVQPHNSHTDLGQVRTCPQATVRTKTSSESIHMDTWTHTHLTHQLRCAAVFFPKQTGTATWHIRVWAYQLLGQLCELSSSNWQRRASLVWLKSLKPSEICTTRSLPCLRRESMLFFFD